MNEKKFASAEDFLKIMASMQELQSGHDFDSLDKIIEEAVKPKTQLSEDELEYVYAAKGNFLSEKEQKNQTKHSS